MEIILLKGNKGKKKNVNDRLAKVLIKKKFAKKVIKKRNKKNETNEDNK